MYTCILIKVSRYRYCNQVLNKDIDSCCTRLLQDLVRFQDRMYHKDPVKVRGSKYTYTHAIHYTFTIKTL